MSVLQNAIDAAEQRKLAALGSEANGLESAASDMQSRAVFSGFDIDYDELVEVANNITGFFLNLTPNMGLQSLFAAAWTDGLLIGLMAASLPPASESNARDGVGSGGD